jgi:hypothetical protein
MIKKRATGSGKEPVARDDPTDLGDSPDWVGAVSTLSRADGYSLRNNRLH